MSARVGGRTLLVTGAAGFIGGHVVDAVARAGWHVRALVRTPRGSRPFRGNHEVVVGDIRDVEVVAHAVRGVDAVVHLAGRMTDASLMELESVNVDGTRVLCAALERHAPHSRFVYFSSAAACGPSTRERPRLESDAPNPLNAYGRSKLAAEHVVERSGLSWVCLRPPLVLGEGARGLGALVTLARLGIAPVLSGAEAPISVIDVDDLAMYCVRALELSTSGACFHVAAPRTTTLASLVETMGVLLERQVHRIPLSRFALATTARLTNHLGRWIELAASVGARLDMLLADAWLLDVRRAERALGACAAPDIQFALAAMLGVVPSSRVAVL